MIKTVSLLYLLGLLVLVAVRLVDVSVIKHQYYQALSEENRLKRIIITAPRGRILGKSGEEIVGNIDLPTKVVFDQTSGFVKMCDTSDTPQFSETKRQYIYGSDFAHLTGYLGLPTEVEGEGAICGRGDLGDVLIGRGGLEEAQNCNLLGTPGEVIFEVDTMGSAVRILGVKKPKPGRDVVTNLDVGLQKKVAGLMTGFKGAVVVSDPKGRILALYSAPAFDPAVITPSLTDPSQPLFNRAISGRFHPGSAYKLLTAMAGLSNGVIDENTLYNDQGFISIKSGYGQFTYNNWYFTQYGGVEGEINVVKALARSTDTFFYDLGERVGIDELDKWAKKLGLDTPSGIDLPGEVGGLVPNPLWKEKTKGEKWFLGNTYHVAIGQGDVELSPLTVNNLTRIVANGGLRCSPKVVGTGKCEDLDIETSVLETVKKGMVGVCLTGGTGYTFFDFKHSVACKTGTAETWEKDVTHAWFTFFTPIDNPQIVVTVLVEGGGEGSKTAGPIARSIADYWYEK